ncbi:hypothetical protein [Pseudoduganella sp.]|uniref:hypothetical protein n=1 Tax=Pseudoduganella sp. TaxID=1880898 RepID=UPI0035B1AED5
MSHNVYAPPLSDLDQQPSAAASDHFYVVSTRKMLIQYFLTLGVYQLYWYYRNWAQQRRATGADVWPLPRALFALFFTHSLFRRIGAHDASGKRDAWDSGSYAAAMVFLLVTDYLLVWASRASPILDGLSWFMLVPLALVMRQAQIEVNARCGDPQGASNDKFSAGNYAWCALGGVLWLLVLVDYLLPGDGGW